MEWLSFSGADIVFYFFFTIKDAFSYFFLIKIKSPPSSPASFTSPNWGTLLLLFNTAGLRLKKSCSDGRYSSWFSSSLFIRYLRKILSSGTSFKVPLVIAFRLGILYNRSTARVAPEKAALVLKIEPAKQASAIRRVCLDLMLAIYPVSELFLNQLAVLSSLASGYNH